MISFFHTILYVPIYNLLIFFVDLIPGGDVGLALIAVTLIIRFVIFPLSLSAVRTQRAMRDIDPELKQIREKYKNDQEKQAKETFALYRKYNIRPFASILTLFIQLPILLSLYLMVRHESLTQANTALLYSFVHVPAVMSPLFLGVFLISRSNLILAIIAAISQFAVAYFSFPLPPKQTPAADGKPGSMQAEFGRAMALQMRYFYPLLYGVIGYTSGAIALYFITGNCVTLLQELYIRTIKKPLVAAPAA